MKQKVENPPYAAIIIELCDCSVADGNFHVQCNQLTRSRRLDKRDAQKSRTTMASSEEISMQCKENRVHLMRYAYLLWIAQCRVISSRNAWYKYFTQLTYWHQGPLHENTRSLLSLPASGLFIPCHEMILFENTPLQMVVVEEFSLIVSNVISQQFVALISNVTFLVAIR